MSKFEMMHHQELKFYVKGLYAEQIAYNMRKRIFSRFNIRPDIEIGGFNDDEKRPIKVRLFATSQILIDVSEFINQSFDFGISE